MRTLGQRQRIQQDVQPVLELRQSGRSIERFIAAVSENDDGRLEGKDVILERLEAVGPRPKAGASVAPNIVAAPAKVAKSDVFIGIATGQRRLPIAVRAARAR